jgi:hypothetical protein
MKDEASGCTLDINGPAIVTMPAEVRDEGIGLLFALAQGPQVVQRLLQSIELRGEFGQLLFRRLRLLAGLHDSVPARSQLLFPLDQPAGLGFQALPQLPEVRLLGLDGGGH